MHYPNALTYSQMHTLNLRQIFGFLLLFTFSVEVHALVQCPTTSSTNNGFALCATGQCWTLDGVSYCKCDLMHEESISLSFNYTEGGVMKDVCDLLVHGVTNGFTMSTYATPDQVLKRYDPATGGQGPAQALYTCNEPGYSVKPAYSAQCDGGVCFTSSTNTEFPGLGHIGGSEIVCSCPPTPNKGPFQISGPWSCAPGEANVGNKCCDRGFYREFCGVRSIKKTGTIISVGSTAGVPKILSTLLDGHPPLFNSCRF